MAVSGKAQPVKITIFRSATPKALARRKQRTEVRPTVNQGTCQV